MTSKGVLIGPEPEDESEHFMVCPICKQAFDMRDLGEVLYHEQEEHEPLKRD